MELFELTTSEDFAFVRARGEIDVSNVGAFSTALLSAENSPGVKTLVIDLTDVGFLDSSGATSLIRSQKRLAAKDRRAVLVCPKQNAEVRRVLLLMGLDEAMPLYESSDEAQAL